MVLQSLTGLPGFLAYFCLSVVAVVAYLWIYTRITPYEEISARGTSQVAMMDPFNRSNKSDICFIHGTTESMMSSPSITAKGSWPTASRATRIA